ncbi:hypothetical protein LTR78_005832 [Recurvomyces mirabilis]|uniref:SET domain-containing protein n=1 Tax=Recurvomyces mirabilis TaxID=574656 RepID=A0AAE1C107_9PEZI|nr:hypothetical protein LTR78_005832 [Recurvomyces mirabilis]KAK5154212.1 hypothetical protein LTS14_006897 [Recurvomyces mirabilis]
MPARATKRKKLSAVTSMPSIGDHHTAFTTWSRNRGVEICNVAPAKLPGKGLGLVTTKKISKDERLLFVPEKAMFKPDLALLKKAKLSHASPQAQLAYSAMMACQNGNEGLRVWRATWPTDEDFEHSLPMRWPKKLREHLPPSIDQPLRRQEEDYAKDLAAVRASHDSSRYFDEDEFRYCWSIVNSRSFHWKPARKGSAGCMVMCPFIDYLNHGSSGTSCNIVQRPHGYEVLAERDYENGEEVLATYGAHTNDKLLVHYGFVLPSNPNTPNIDDDIRLDHILLPALTETVSSQLQDTGFLGGYALLPASNELCFKTQVAVRAMLLTCNEWEYFVSSGEDLARDETAAVLRFMRPLLVKYRDDARQKLEILGGNDVASGGLENEVGILRTRWKQIVDGLDVFLAE